MSEVWNRQLLCCIDFYVYTAYIFIDILLDINGVVVDECDYIYLADLYSGGCISDIRSFVHRFAYNILLGAYIWLNLKFQICEFYFK